MSGCPGPPLWAHSLGGMPWWANAGRCAAGKLQEEAEKGRETEKEGLDFSKN